MADQGETFESFVRNSLKDLKCVPSELNNIKSSLEKIVRDHADLSKSVQFLSEQTSDLEKIVKTQSSDISNIKAQLQSQDKQNALLQKKITQLEERNLSQEMYTRRHNVIIEGLLEEENEVTKSLVLNCLTKAFKIQLNDDMIDKCHRYGKSINGRPRPVIARFVNHSTRDRVLYTARNLKTKPKNVYVNEDLPYEIKARRADVRAVAKFAKTQGATVKQRGKQ